MAGDGFSTDYNRTGASASNPSSSDEATLRPGQRLNARVTDHLGNGVYALRSGSRTLRVQSPKPLMSGQILRMEVGADANGQRFLRIIPDNLNDLSAKVIEAMADLDATAEETDDASSDKNKPGQAGEAKTKALRDAIEARRDGQTISVDGESVEGRTDGVKSAADAALRRAGMSASGVAGEAAEALLLRQAPVERGYVAALSGLAAGRTSEGRGPILAAGARLIAQDAPVAAPLASGLVALAAAGGLGGGGMSAQLDQAIRALADASAWLLLVDEAETPEPPSASEEKPGNVQERGKPDAARADGVVTASPEDGDTVSVETARPVPATTVRGGASPAASVPPVAVESGSGEALRPTTGATSSGATPVTARPANIVPATGLVPQDTATSGTAGPEGPPAQTAEASVASESSKAPSPSTTAPPAATAEEAAVVRIPLPGGTQQPLPAELFAALERLALANAVGVPPSGGSAFTMAMPAVDVVAADLPAMPGGSPTGGGAAGMAEPWSRTVATLAAELPEASGVKIAPEVAAAETVNDPTVAARPGSGVTTTEFRAVMAELEAMARAQPDITLEAALARLDASGSLPGRSPAEPAPAPSPATASGGPPPATPSNGPPSTSVAPPSPPTGTAGAEIIQTDPAAATSAGRETVPAEVAKAIAALSEWISTQAPELRDATVLAVLNRLDAAATATPLPVNPAPTPTPTMPGATGTPNSAAPMPEPVPGVSSPPPSTDAAAPPPIPETVARPWPAEIPRPGTVPGGTPMPDAAPDGNPPTPVPAPSGNTPAVADTGVAASPDTLPPDDSPVDGRVVARVTREAPATVAPEGSGQAVAADTGEAPEISANALRFLREMMARQPALSWRDAASTMAASAATTEPAPDPATADTTAPASRPAIPAAAGTSMAALVEMEGQDVWARLARIGPDASVAARVLATVALTARSELADPMATGLATILEAFTRAGQTTELSTPAREALRELAGLAVALDADDAGVSLARFVKTLGRESLGRASAWIEQAAGEFLAAHPALSRIDAAMTELLRRDPGLLIHDPREATARDPELVARLRELFVDDGDGSEAPAERARRWASELPPEQRRAAARELQTLERELVSRESGLQRLTDAAQTVRDLGRQALAAKAETVARERQDPAWTACQVPLRMGSEQGGGQMQMFYRKAKRGGQGGWSSRVVLDLDTTRLGAVLGDLRFVGRELNLALYLPDEDAARFLAEHAEQLADALAAKGFGVKASFGVLPPDRDAAGLPPKNPWSDAAPDDAPKRTRTGRLDIRV